MKQIKDFPDYYITENAEIISKRCKNEKKLKQSIDKFGYYCVALTDRNNKVSVERIHRLMMLNYGQNPPENMINPTVDHINGNKKDNRIDNLQWLSNSDNAQKAAKNRIKTYTIITKTNKTIIITNLSKWCKNNDLDKSSLLRSYKTGWWHKDYKIISK